MGPGFCLDRVSLVYVLCVLQELLRVNLLKGAANLLRSAHPIGRAALPLREICEKPFKRQELELRWGGGSKVHVAVHHSIQHCCCWRSFLVMA